ncbi:hypothetical protein D3C72_1526310 [compost metagenome]
MPFHFVFGQIVWIFGESRFDFFFDNTFGYIPIRTEDNVFHVGMENNGFIQGFAYNHFGEEYRLTILEIRQLKGRNIDYNKFFGFRNIGRKPSATLHIDHNGFNTGGYGDV